MASDLLQAYQEAGADALYAPGLTSLDDIRTVVREVDRPVNVLALASGPAIPDLAAAGVRRVSVGSAFAQAAYGAAVQAAREFRDQGSYAFRRPPRAAPPSATPSPARPPQRSRGGPAVSRSARIRPRPRPH